MSARLNDIAMDVIATRGRGLKHITATRSNQPTLVLESDDWGGERVRSLEVRDALVRERALPPEGEYHNDALERAEDLVALGEVLASVTDAHGRTAVISPFVNPANPDFEAIRERDFTEYVWEPMTRTLARRGDEREVMTTWRELVQRGVLAPEYHGREHLHVRSWMNALRHDPIVRKGFDRQVFSVNASGVPAVLRQFRAAYFFETKQDLPELHSAIVSGARAFADIFGRSPTSFCPPNNVFHPLLYGGLEEAGLRMLASPLRRVEPDLRGGSRQVWRWDRPGKRSFRTLARNALFEPSAGYGVDGALRQIASAFQWGVPAVVSTHRVHYVGAVDVAHRDRGLRALSTLLREVVKRWPNIRFMSSATLYESGSAD
jgi:hypothetical protein